MLYLYARVSTDKQENGRDAQVDRLLRWAGDRQVDGVFVDEDVSAHSVRFQDRPEGKKLWDLLGPGDVVVATKMDRMFRRLADMASTIDSWKQLDIRLVLLDMDVDITTPTGRAFAGWSAVAAQLESELHGQRKREVYAHKKKNGQPYSTTRPFGWTVTKGKDGRLAGWQECPKEREVGARVLALRATGMSWSRIATELVCAGMKKPRGCRAEWYYDSDLPLLARAAEAGYPKIAQGAWRVRGNGQTQPAG